MIVSWSKQAGKSLNNTTTYIKNAFGEKAALSFLHEIQHITDILESNPFAGPIEPLLLHKRRTYRSIVLTRQNNNTIRIAAFWDTRREPKELVEELK